MKPENNLGFDKSATQQESDTGLIKRGVAETAAARGTEADGFLNLQPLKTDKPANK